MKVELRHLDQVVDLERLVRRMGRVQVRVEVVVKTGANPYETVPYAPAPSASR